MNHICIAAEYAEHEMQVAAAADWIIDMGAGAGDAVAALARPGTPPQFAANRASKNARVYDVAADATR
ncbi:MAG: hypothetical protein ABI356_01225 [Steroidobacteraceae bacterium]